MEDLKDLKNQIRRFIELKHINIIEDNPPRCTCPAHDDKNPSAIIYPDNVYCPVCCVSFDIFAFSKALSGENSFPEIIKDVKLTLGIYDNPGQKALDNVVSLTSEKALQIFNGKDLLRMSEFIGGVAAGKKKLDLDSIGKQKLGYGDIIAGIWHYKNENGLIDIVDVRFEGGPKKKAVVSFYYNGKSIKSKNAPIRLYNADLIKLYPDHYIMIVEGAKSANYAMKLLDYGILPVTWNRGTANITKCDWSPLYGRKVLFYPDDDRHKDKKTGELLPSYNQPGIKAALKFKEEFESNFESFKIISPLLAARGLKANGADIVEALEALEPEKLIDYIFNSEEYKPEKKIKEKKKPAEIGSIEEFEEAAPFKILGVDDSQYCNFLCESGYIFKSRLETLSNKKLLVIAPLDFWQSILNMPQLGQNDWLICIDTIIRIANKISFDPDNIRAVGAHKDIEGRICFHTGQKTYGEYDNNKVFLKKVIKPGKEIGIGCPPLDYSTIEKMKEIVFRLSFKTNVDAMRCLGFSVLAPFSGALDWRPQAFLTGPSESGKSSVENNIVKMLAIPERFNGIKTTAAGYYQKRKNDSGCCTIEEFEAKTDKEKKNREDLLGIMRGSTSDDTPKSAIGTADGSGLTYSSRDMFLFIAIDSEIGNVADDNRLFRINMVKPKKNGETWRALKNDLKKYFTHENCKRIRSMVWQNLKIIMELANIISEEIQIIANKAHRYSIIQGYLIAAYLVIWKNNVNPTIEEIRKTVNGIYQIKEVEENRDESQDMIDLILQEKTKVYFSNQQKEFSFSDIIGILHSGTIDAPTDNQPNGIREITKQERLSLKNAIEINGVYIYDKKLAIVNNHKEIKKILNRKSGYSRMLKRHEKCVDSNKGIRRNGQLNKCSVFDILDNYTPF